MLLISLLVFFFLSAYLIKAPCLLSYNLFETEALCYLSDYTNFLFNALKLKGKRALIEYEKHTDAVSSGKHQDLKFHFI